MGGVGRSRLAAPTAGGLVRGHEFVATNATVDRAGRHRNSGRRSCLPRLETEYDPPAFIKAQKDKNAGMRGYRQINALAMKLLPPGGILVSSSCSHYLFWQDMLDMLVAAAQDADRSFTILDRTTQGPDHPVLLSMPESEYLRGFKLQVS